MIGSTKEKYPLLTKQEQIEYWKQYQILVTALANDGLSFNKTNVELFKRKNPDQKKMVFKALKARENLILSNEGMVIQLASHYAKDSFITAEELIQVGREACIYALTKYNPYNKGRETKFSSYAMIWIRSKILEAAKKSYQVTVPGYAQKAGYTQYQFISHEYISENSPDIYDRLVTEPDDDILGILSDDEIETLSHHFTFSGKNGNQNQSTLDLWGDGARVESIIRKLREAVAV
jgi:RNA polymerase sigma factor (sigma-70 family)